MRSVWHPGAMTPQELLVWYKTLYSRTIDLVGDYAGDELFIIDGDSLLLQSFSDGKLDFSPGFQVLHATHLVETLLHKLQRRNCAFHIVFFADNAHLCIPAGTVNKLRYRYLLAREAIIRHLIENSPAAASAKWIKEFSSYKSPDLRSYLLMSGAYFFMCHDGGFPESSATKVTADGHNKSEHLSTGSDTDIVDDKETNKEQSVYDSLPNEVLLCRIDLRRMIYEFMNHGYNVALVNSLEFRDTKIISMIVERSTRNTVKWHSNVQPNYDAVGSKDADDSGKDSSDSNILPDQEDISPLYVIDKGAATSLEESYTLRTFSNAPATSHDKSEELPNTNMINSQRLEIILTILKTIRPDFTHREYLVVATLVMMVEFGSITEDELGAARVMLLHMIILRDCSISDRAIPQVPDIGGQNFLDHFAKRCLDI